MATIDINHAYTMPKDQVLEQLRQLEEKIAERYQLDCSWTNETCLTFNRSGASGHIDVEGESVKVHMTLGMMLGMFKRSIETEICDFLNENIR